jgi:LysM repeat protein
MPSRVTSSSVRTPSVPQSVPQEVTVASGDSLGKIAQRMGVSVSALVQANVGKYPSLAQNQNAIQVGWKLAAPGAQATQAPAQTAPAAGWQGSASTQRTTTTGGVTRPNDLGTKLAAAGAQSIELRMKAHNDSIDKTGIGTYYGDHSYFKSMSPEEKKEWLKQNTKAGATTPAMPKENSCIGWAMENVGAAYKAAGKTERWNEIMGIVTSKGSKGIDLAKELQKDGWQAIYWNPDAKHPDDSNPEHSFSAAQVSRGNGYYGLKITDTVENYRPTAGQGTKQDMSGIDKLSKVPFFFGMAKGGVHTFVGRQGNVNEFHWSETPDSHHAIQETPLKDWGWNSGVIMVPPGTWPQN